MSRTLLPISHIFAFCTRQEYSSGRELVCLGLKQTPLSHQSWVVKASNTATAFSTGVPG